jgi:DNA-binding transcriptional LysR family regulator
MDTLLSLRVFCAVAELKSFTAASERLGLSAAMTSKHVMHLERKLATRLLNRTSRHVSLTEAGMLYFEQVHHTLDGLDEAEAANKKTAVTPRGTLKLSAPVWMANAVFAAMLADYHSHYPDVRLDIDLSGRIVNLVEEGFDLALRATASPDPGLIAKRLVKVEFQLVAAPGFLKRFERPNTLADLKDAPLLAYSVLSPDGRITLETKEGPKTIKFNPLLSSPNETLLYELAVAGMGLTFLPRWMTEAALADKRLELVLPGSALGVNTLYAVYPSRKYLSAKVRTFLDFVARDPRLK